MANVLCEAESVDETRHTPDASSDGHPDVDDSAVTIATGARSSKWGKLRHTVKATTVFASTVSEPAAAAASTRASRRKPDSQDDDRRDSFLKRFSTRQTSCGTSYLQAAVAADATPTSNSNAEPEAKVLRQN